MMFVAWGVVAGVVAALVTGAAIRYARLTANRPAASDTRRKVVRLQVTWVIFGGLFGVVAYATSNSAFDWLVTGLAAVYVAIVVAMIAWMMRRSTSPPRAQRG